LLVSRPIDEVLREAEKLARAGVKEILVISQDTSAYGVDIRYRRAEWRGEQYETRFQDLARGLGSLGIWIRMHYVYPYPHVDNVIPLMAERKVLPYLDIPFQHGSPTVLKRMKRPGMVEKTLNRIEAWREVCPDLTIRSTFIVGFPGETEAEFDELLAWLDEAQLDRVGAFKYSPVEGAVANDLAAHVPEDIQEERLARFMQKSAAISAAKLAAKVGQRMQVLVDAHDGNRAVARSMADAPEIDGVVKIAQGDKGGKLKIGEFAEVEITGSSDHDLDARLLRNASFP
jgi:ribosomal protein S12 methylthiotransferase